MDIGILPANYYMQTFLQWLQESDVTPRYASTSVKTRGTAPGVENVRFSGLEKKGSRGPLVLMVYNYTTPNGAGQKPDHSTWVPIDQLSFEDMQEFLQAKQQLAQKQLEKEQMRQVVHADRERLGLPALSSAAKPEFQPEKRNLENS